MMGSPGGLVAASGSMRPTDLSGTGGSCWCRGAIPERWPRASSDGETRRERRSNRSRVLFILRPAASYMLRMLTARAATTPTVRNDAIDSSSIRVLMRTLSGMASVGLNALAFVNAT